MSTAVAERGVVISTRGLFDIERALPEASARSLESPRAAELAPRAAILSVSELEAFERANIVRALEAAAWKVCGDGGAAALLQMNVSTLNSRMRALGIRRPRGS
jgi:transcriptional regulator with GAF, ATPase, and Fis domain